MAAVVIFLARAPFFPSSHAAGFFSIPQRVTFNPYRFLFDIVS
jgi:hypothetical protein